MKIEINCTGSDTIQLHELTEFQGELKERSAAAAGAVQGQSNGVCYAS